MAITLELPSGQIFIVENDSATIGRSSGNDIVIPDSPEIQPVHATITQAANKWMIESAGDWLLQVGNGVPGRKLWLKPNDSIRLSESGPIIVFEPVTVRMAPTSKAVSVLAEEPPPLPPLFQADEPPPLPFNADIEEPPPLPFVSRSFTGQLVIPKRIVVTCGVIIAALFLFFGGYIFYHGPATPHSNDLSHGSNSSSSSITTSKPNRDEKPVEPINSYGSISSSSSRDTTRPTSSVTVNETQKPPSTTIEKPTQFASMANGPINWQELLDQLDIKPFTPDGGIDPAATSWECLSSGGFRISCASINCDNYHDPKQTVPVVFVHTSDGKIVLIQWSPDCDLKAGKISERDGYTMRKVMSGLDFVYPEAGGRKFIFSDTSSLILNGVKKITGRAILNAKILSGKLTVTIAMDPKQRTCGLTAEMLQNILNQELRFYKMPQ